MNVVGRTLRVRKSNKSFQNKLMTGSYQILTPTVPSLFTSTESKNKGIEGNKE